MSRGCAFALVALLPVLVVAGLGGYLLSLAGELPWQTDPTPISAGVTPFAEAGRGDPTTTTPGTARGADAIAASPSGSPQAALPAGGVAFAIVGDQSKVRYVVREKLAGVPVDSDAVAETNAIVGRIALDAAGRPVAGSTFQVDLRLLKSDKVRRDNDVKKFYLETDKYPIATFVLRRVDALSGLVVDGATVTAKIVGDLTAHGVTKSVTWDTTATLKDDLLSGHATTSFPFADFGMDVPAIAGMVSARDPVTLELDFTAKRSG